MRLCELKRRFGNVGILYLTQVRLILHKELRSREGSQDRSGRILRAIGLGGQILSDLGIQRIRLLSNTPMHIPALEGFGLEIVEQVPIPVEERSSVECG